MLPLLVAGSLLLVAQGDILMRIAGQTQAAAQYAERWIVTQQDLAFDVRVVAVADEAVEDVCRAAGIPFPPQVENLVSAGQVQRCTGLLGHVIAARHATDEIQTTLIAKLGQNPVAAKSVPVREVIVDADGRLTIADLHQRIVVQPKVTSLSLRNSDLLARFGLQQPQSIEPPDPASDWTIRCKVPVGDTLLLVVTHPRHSKKETLRFDDHQGVSNLQLEYGTRFCFITPRRIPKGIAARPQ